MSENQQVKLFLTQEHHCSYLEGKQAQTLFVDPDYLVDEVTYAELNTLGFRRSGSHFYRPHCEQCQSCLATRVIVEDFQPNRGQRRAEQKNSDVETTLCDSIVDEEEHYQLYESYISKRHAKGDMYPPSIEQFTQFIADGCFATRFVEFRVDKKLIAVLVLDQLADGLSAVYTYFDPMESKRSLGVYAIVTAIRKASELSLPFVYLGYFIAGCDKMEYKANYRPLQMLVDHRWTIVE